MLKIYEPDFQNEQATSIANGFATFERTPTRTSASSSALLI